MIQTEIREALEKLRRILSSPGLVIAGDEDDSVTNPGALLDMIEERLQGRMKVFRHLTSIALSLSSEKDISTLLKKILSHARELTNADAGTLYLVDHRKKTLTFEIIQNASMNLDLQAGRDPESGFAPVPMQKDNRPNTGNVSSYVALCGEKINIPDVYSAQGFDFSGTKAYDRKSGYRSRSMLVIPMCDHGTKVIGVLQIINAVDPGTGKITAFTREHEEIVEALASQAAIALTNTRLIQNLENLLQRLKVMHKREKAALEEKSIMEHQRAQSLNKLALSVAHQIRNPIMTIGGFVQLARKHQDKPEKISNYLDYILDSARRLQSMAGSVDQFASMGNPDPGETSLASFILPACEGVQAKALETETSLDIVLPDNLDQKVRGDPGQLKTAVEAVLENALEAGREAGNRNIVTIRAERVQDRTRLAFIDEGPGIPGDVLPYVLDPFFTTRADKAGMGLTIAHRIAGLNMGSLEIHSSPGNGVTVTISLQAPIPQSRQKRAIKNRP